MRKILWLALLAIPVIVIVTLPASVVAPRLDAGEDLHNVRGTLWEGKATWQQPGFVPVDLDWSWQGGRSWRWQADGVGTDLSGTWRAGAGGTELADVRGTLSMDRFDVRLWLANARPRGEVMFDIDRALIAEDQAPQIDGRLVWQDARLEGTVHESLGEITVTFSSEGSSQLARVESTREGAIQVRGRIDLEVDRYTVDLWLRARSDRPELARQLAWLGEPQPDGQVRVQLSGALGW